MRARIYKPARNAMQSGVANTRTWALEFAPTLPRDVDPLMGWTSSADTLAQVRLHFDSKEAALEYAKGKSIDAVVLKPQHRRPNIRAGGYGENFAPSRRTVWTH